MNTKKLLYAMMTLTLALSMVACKSPNVTPQASIAHYGTDVVNSVNTFQDMIVKASAGPTPVLSVQAAQPIMTKIRATLNDAEKLSAQLKIYDTAVGPAKNDAGRSALALLATISASTIADGLPAQLASQGQKIVANIKNTVATVKASLSAAGVQPAPAGAVVP